MNLTDDTANPMYNFTEFRKIADIVPVKPFVKDWHTDPSDFDAAARAAAHYAKRDNVPMMVVPGNSYMQRVFHIEPISSTKALMGKQIKIGIVHPNGEVFTVQAVKKVESEPYNDLQIDGTTVCRFVRH